MPSVLSPISPSDFNELVRNFGADIPLKRLFQLAMVRGCKTIVHIDGFEDEEYLAEYESLYKHLFKEYPDKADCLYFFSSEFSLADLAHISDFESSYLGCVILRPFPSQKVAKAIIAPQEDQNNPKRSFVLCQGEFKQEVLGCEMAVKGFPFIQQDSHVGTCAHAALAMVALYLATEAGAKAMSMPEIVEITSDISRRGREISAGLGIEQISEVIKAMDRSPLVYEFRIDDERARRFPPERVIYRYIESGIPIILGIPTAKSGHALTIVGHSFDPDMWWPMAEKPYYSQGSSEELYSCSTAWIDNFIVHDDNFGPYSTIQTTLLHAMAIQGFLWVVIPLPKGIYLKGEDAESYAYEMISSVLQLMPKDAIERAVDAKTAAWFNRLTEAHGNQELVLRTFLIESDELVNNYAAPNLRGFYGNMTFPKKVWLTEISTPELFCQFRLRLGEIVMDPTAMRAFGHMFLSIHLPGLAITRDTVSEAWTVFTLQDDYPTEHVIR